MRGIWVFAWATAVAAPGDIQIRHVARHDNTFFSYPQGQRAAVAYFSKYSFTNMTVA
jgi:hypothetical protein